MAMVQRMMTDPAMMQDPAMQQMMQNPAMMQHVLQQMQGGGPPAKFEDPMLTALLDPIREHKRVGGEFFKKRERGRALAAYQAGIAAAGGTMTGSLAWPQVEALVFACRSNAALCLLQLKRPKEAVAECNVALAMACANGSELLPKVLARKLQGLIDAEMPTATILSYLDELRRRGSFDQGNTNTPAFVEQVARMGSDEGGSSADRAFDVLTEHWLASGAISQPRLDAATDKIAAAADATHDRAVLSELASLAAPSTPASDRMPIHVLIQCLISSFTDDAHPQPPDPARARRLLRYTLLDGGMHPSYPGSVDPDGGGTLVWALCSAFERSLCTEADVETFERLLSILVDAGADINQRSTEGARPPVMFVMRSGCLRAVRAMLAKGANIHLRDDEGFTPLLCTCMNDVTRPQAPERVACLQCLIDAGADVNAQTVIGGSAMLMAATHDVSHLALIEALLAAGADANLRTKTGDTPAKCLQMELSREKKSPQHAEVERVLALITAASGPQAELEIAATKFVMLLDKVLVPAHNAGVRDPDIRARKERWDKAGGKAATHARLLAGEELTELDKRMFHDRHAQERRIVTALLRHFGMDASLVGGRPPLASDGNWLLELHEQITAALPAPCRAIYPADSQPTDDEIALFAQGDSEAREGAMVEDGQIRTVDQAKLRRAVMTRHRDRGQVPTLLSHRVRELIVEPLQHAVGYAVPNEDALRALTTHAPLIEMGAGTGYWTALLQQRGVDVVAYDSAPPSADMTNNFFYDFSFTNVLKGGGATLFVDKPELAARTLVLIWPNNPDAEDNPRFAVDAAAHPIWDADCLQAFLAAGGQTVIYVGERETEITVEPGAHPDSGITGSRRFQTMLGEHFTLAQRVAIPNWYTTVDDLTVWVRRV